MVFRFLRFTKISLKLTLLYALIFSLILIFLNASVLYGIKFFLVKEACQKADDTIDMLEERIHDKSNERMNFNDPELIGESRYDRTLSVRIADTQGLIVNSSNKFGWTQIPFIKQPNSIKKIKRNNLHLIIENKNILDKGQIKAYIQVTVNMEKEYIFLKALFYLMAGADLAGIAISLLAGYLLSKKMLLPIDRITKAAQSISINNLDKRIEVGQTNDELTRLGGTFNEMIDRLQLSFEKQNQFVSDASHELRTPIAVIQGYIGLMDRWGKEDKMVLQESIDAIKSEAAQMTELIEKLLFLARGDSGTLKLVKSEFSLNELISEVYKESCLISHLHSFRCELDEEITLSADRKMIKQALRALIDNSIKFTPPDGEIVVHARKETDRVCITIRDTGIGIPEGEVNNIFNRFYCVDKSRFKEFSGSGLGLSIVKWIVDVHGGSIQAESTAGDGTVIAVMLP